MTAHKQHNVSKSRTLIVMRKFIS